MVEQLFNELADRGVTLVSDGDRLRYYPRAKMTPELVERLREHKAEVVAVIADPWPADYNEPEPCEKCNGLDLWETFTGRWRCSKCDPPTRARRLLEKAERMARNK